MWIVCALCFVFLKSIISFVRQDVQCVPHGICYRLYSYNILWWKMPKINVQTFFDDWQSNDKWITFPTQSQIANKISLSIIVISNNYIYAEHWSKELYKRIYFIIYSIRNPIAMMKKKLMRTNREIEGKSKNQYVRHCNSCDFINILYIQMHFHYNYSVFYQMENVNCRYNMLIFLITFLVLAPFFLFMDSSHFVHRPTTHETW